jgi:hypothetical protein
VYPDFHFKYPDETFSKLFQVPFYKKIFATGCLKKNEDLGNIYEKETKKYRLYALEKPIKFKEVYFCRLHKEKLEYFVVNEEIDSFKITTKNNIKNFVILYNFEEKILVILLISLIVILK